MFSIGVILESFRLPPEEAIARAAALGAQGLQVYATHGKLGGRDMTPAWKKEFLARVKDNGLVISALCGDLGHGFGDAQRNPALVDESKRILDAALELETRIVTTHIGLVPELDSHPRWGIMQEACAELAAHADSLNAFFAVETGPEPAALLGRFLGSLHSRGVSVNMDPANLVMVCGDDPVAAVHTLKDYIVHTHAKDGRMLMAVDREVLYGFKAGERPSSRPYQELPLGTGDVPFDRYLDALREIGYQGFLTIEREVGDDPAVDIGLAIEFLKARQ